MKEVAIATPGTKLNNHDSVTKVAVKNVLDVVNLVQDLPPCNKIATSLLMHTCVSSPGSNANAMESLSTVYGTRLAVCELYNAGADIPAACTKFVPSQDMLGKLTAKGFIRNGGLTDPQFSYHAYDANTAAASQKCTKALYNKPQTWTSFSNSRQNSLAICQAMRVEIDKDELVSILAEVKRQSDEFSQTSHSSLEILRQLHEFAKQTHEQYLESQTIISDTSISLANALNVTNNDVVDLVSFLTEASVAMYNLNNDVQSSLVLVAGQIHNLSGDLVEAQQAMAEFGEELGYLDRQISTARQTVLLLEKTTAATADNISSTLDDMNNMAKDALSNISMLTKLFTFGEGFVHIAMKAVTVLAIFFGVRKLSVRLYYLKAGICEDVAKSVAAGIGSAVAATYNLFVLDKETAPNSPRMVLAISLAILAWGLGSTLAICEPKIMRGGEGGDKPREVASESSGATVDDSVETSVDVSVGASVVASAE
ncbi:hypothetical protein K461DRAFT_48432 [Myriangium duriaei CBS 260.36]|uniref:Nuclear fusion protein KAR5 n=1 Tax=Myriangium duriaei CBS 260.36 TaxID=1168546 RepID=A0A9P4IZC5_9PEZI|nr:hypothetical protein K461DRAFT_48432 [Myriangium duriaei CBS 260.36]